MSRLEEYRKSFNPADAIQLMAWRDIVRNGDTERYREQGLQCFARDDMIWINGTRPETLPYLIECYRLCPLTLAACDGDKRTYELFLGQVKGHGDGELLQEALNVSLAMVVKTHDVEKIRYILDQGADVNAHSVIAGSDILGAICGDYYVSEEDNIRIAALLIQHGVKNFTAAMCGAAYNYRVNLLQFLLDHGASAIGYAIVGPITRAGFEDQFRVPQILLEHGADPNFAASNGHSALLWAAFHNAQTSAKLLLLYGANPDHTATLCLEATVPLHVAAIRGYGTIVALLLRGFCDVNRPAKLLPRNYEALRTAHPQAEFREVWFTALEAVCLAPPRDTHGDIAGLLLAAGARTRLPGHFLGAESFPDPGMHTLFLDFSSQPAPLVLLCRVVIRDCVKGRGEGPVRQRLPLPAALVSYVLMERETEPFLSHLQHFERVHRDSHAHTISPTALETDSKATGSGGKDTISMTT